MSSLALGIVKVRMIQAQFDQPGGATPDPIPAPHFPDRVHLFVWRNWELANTARLAQVLETTSDRVLAIGYSMGLPRKIELTDDQLARMYITVIRQNWHILPQDQMIELLGWNPTRFEYTLKEDDFLWIKLGSLKPRCERLRYQPPTTEVEQRAATIKHVVGANFGASLDQAGEPAFDFVRQLSNTQQPRMHDPNTHPADGGLEERQGANLATGSLPRESRHDPNIVYSYFALYGDPLIDEKLDPFPNGLLDKLARVGVNGVWMQAVLRNLAPSRRFPEFGAGAEIRLRSLTRLVERARDYGIKIYLYLNEPRSMPAEFFQSHPDIKGTHDVRDAGFFAMCTSTSEVRQWLADSLAHVFSAVPGLGGIFCITASENLTNCFSHGHAEFCPRCSQRDGSEVIAEVIQTFRDGVRRASASATVIAWDWGWGRDWVPNCADSAKVIERLPTDVSLLSVSEWNIPITRGGFATKVGEYSISVVGPGPRALRNWELAQRRGLAPLAKVQWSNTWEISAVPYIPVPNLIAEHCENLRRAGINGFLASWTVGGYPSPNFEVAREYGLNSRAGANEVLHQVAVRRYGEESALAILEAWKIFSDAFQNYPMEGGGVVYRIPTQHGPANLLYLHPTGYKAGMMLFPYDDYKHWVGNYPVEVVERQFEKMAGLWEQGVAAFRKGLEQVPASRKAVARKDLRIAETCGNHFRSVANQFQFCRLRDQMEAAPGYARRNIALQMLKIAEEEIGLAKRQYAIARQDSTIGYEASNHYYYRPLDLVEKVINCEQIVGGLKELLASLAEKGGSHDALAQRI